MVWSEENTDNFYWGTGLSFEISDAEDATRYDDEAGDFSKEITIYEKSLKVEQKRLAASEIEAMNTLTEMLAIN